MGHAFQREVWQALRAIPCGQDAPWSAGGATGTTGAARAVGAANGANPISIVVLAIASLRNGTLTGYAGAQRKSGYYAMKAIFIMKIQAKCLIGHTFM